MDNYVDCSNNSCEYDNVSSDTFDLCTIHNEKITLICKLDYMYCD